MKHYDSIVLKNFDNIKILSAVSLMNDNKIKFADLVSNVYKVTDYICKDYPDYFQWYWSKAIPDILRGTREILVCLINQKIAGVAILKNDNIEKKICTFFVLKEFRKMGIGTLLLEEAFEFLGTTKPLITIADNKVDMFKGIINKYGWKQTEILNEEYYNNTHKEIVFNGKISK